MCHKIGNPEDTVQSEQAGTGRAVRFHVGKAQKSLLETEAGRAGRAGEEQGC